MECTSIREQLRDLVRGRVDAAAAAELRGHVAACDACRHEQEAERLLDVALLERLPRPAAPAALRRRVVETLEGSPAARPEAPGRRRSWRAAGLAAAAVVLASIGFVTGRATVGRTVAGERLADEAVSDHLRALVSAHPHDVESGDSHQVKPWFEGRLDFAPVVPGDRGELRLLGGAVGYVLDRKAAVVSYALRRHRLTLLAFPCAGLPGFDAGARSGPPRRVARRGFDVAWWAAGDVGYALVGDVPGSELGALATDLARDTRR